jgi:hypothetical protein
MQWNLRAAALAGLAVLLCGVGCSPAPSSTARTYRMGDQVLLGGLAYNVYDSRWLTHLGEGAGARVPENRFFLVRVSIANSGSSEVVVPGMTLADDTGGARQELSSGEQVPQWLGLVRTVKPGQSIQGNIAFDCAPGTYKLRLTDESERHAALVDIPLTFTAETPESPLSEVPQK